MSKIRCFSRGRSRIQFSPGVWCYFPLVIVLLGGCLSSAHQSVRKSDADIVFNGTILNVSDLKAGSTADVFESADSSQPGKLSTLVLFRIDRVLKGEFDKVRAGGPSEYEQAKSALKSGKILKVITLDFNNPDSQEERKWVSVAVKDEKEKFRITDRANPPRTPIRLFLKRNPEDSGGYILQSLEFLAS